MLTTTHLISRTPPFTFSPLAVAAAEIKFENYVLSRGGTRLIRKILIANNGCTSPLLSFRFFFFFFFWGDGCMKKYT